MRILSVIGHRLRSLFRGDQLDAEAREELAQHFERQIEQHLASGLSPEAARRAAALEVGGIAQIAEAARDARGLVWLDVLRADVRYAFRQIGKRPGFSAAAILTLALGVGATSAVFAVVDAVLLRPLPYPESNRLYSLYEINTRANVGRTRAAALNFMDWRDQSTTVDGMAAHIGTGFSLTGRGEPAFVLGQQVTPNFLDVLQVRPVIGRNFRPEETEAGRHRVVILTHGLWNSYFGGDPSVIDTSTTINGQPYQIIGVLPASFAYPSSDYRLLAPFVTKGTIPGAPPISRSARYLRVVGRLAAGVTEASARSELDAIGSRLAAAYADTNGTVTIGMTSLAGEVVGDAETNLIVVLVAVGFVLLIACVNVAGLSIARGHARGRELAIRTAIGASRSRLVRQLATEGLLLFVCGGALGLALAAWSITALSTQLPASIPRVDEIAIDWRFLIFGGLVTAAAGLIFSILPAIQVARRGPSEGLAGSRGTVSAARSAQRTRGLLIVAQVAVAIVLLTGAALALRSFQHVNDADKGFDPSRTMTFSFVVRDSRFPTADDMRVFLTRVTDALQAHASTGIEAAGTTTHLPLADNNLENSFTVDGSPVAAGQDPPIAGVRGVAGRYRVAIGARLIEGRDFAPRDNATSQPVAIVTADFARRHVTSASALGARVKMGGVDSDDPWRTIVGVIADIRHGALDKEPRPEVWLPFAQLPDGLVTTWLRGVYVAARTTTEPTSTIPALRAAMRSLDSTIPLVDVQSMDALARESTAERRLETSLLAGFASIALGLAAIGLFGVLAFYVAQHMQEFGVRLALGATPGGLLALVMRRGLGLLAAGLAMGLPGALLIGRGMSTLLYRVDPMDPLALGAAAGVLAVVTVAACAVPARRAMRVDPLVALRRD